jgi:CheY-like chemotaxis protein
MRALRFCIVLIEDNPADAEILRFALSEADAPVEIIQFETGPQALHYLGANSAPPAEGSFSCDLVLLDLNLPIMNGFEVLGHIRGTKHLKTLPVVVMSGSKNAEDIDQCYLLGANSYVSKPAHLPDILTVANQIVDYWFKCAKLPSRCSLPTQLTSIE